MPRRNICIAEDNEDVRRLLERVLEQVGFSVVSAGDGDTALAALENRNTNVLVTDIVMPEREGLELIQTVRRRFPHVRILAMSGVADGMYLTMAKELGADDCLPKPFSYVEFLSKVVALAGQASGQDGSSAGRS